LLVSDELSSTVFASLQQHALNGRNADESFASNPHGRKIANLRSAVAGALAKAEKFPSGSHNRHGLGFIVFNHIQ
jgi:hypothetical protein